MGPIDFIVIAVVLAIVALAAWYVIRAKKNGAKCIGCPSGCDCSKSKTGKADANAPCSCGCCSCGGQSTPEESSDDESADGKK